ncbi:MAG TPA: tyrosine-type recombinase/integrase [Xanthobacteraceae bacterium]
MPRPRPPHLHREITRHGKPVWYVRIGKGARVRLRAEFGSPEFDVEYQAALTGSARPQEGKPDSKSLAWLWKRYRETGAWLNELSPATRRQRENIMKHVLIQSGTKPYALITSRHIIDGRERRSTTPAQARNFLDLMRGLFAWAMEAQHVKVDPTATVKNPPRKKGPGFKAWTEADVEAYYRRWPLGTHERVWLDVLLYSGLRRGDVVRYGKQHVRNGIGKMRLEKGDEELEVTLPILPVLGATLAAGPCGDLTFIVGKQGKPLAKESFGNAFKEACMAAGIFDKSAHGVRKIAATTAANNGATVSQLKALFGWESDSMPALYTKAADRERLARDSAHKLENAERTSIPAPKRQVRAPE